MLGRMDGGDIDLFGRPFRPDDLDSLKLRSSAGFEAAELAFVGRTVRPGQVCLDIGANIGLFTVALAHAAGPDGWVHAFEPDPDNFALLQRNAAPWQHDCHIRLHAMACGTEDGNAQLHRSTENRGMHRLYDSACCQGEAVEVPVRRIDDVVNGPVDFIKIDIEGFEPFAVRGATETIRRSPRLVLMTEFSPLSMLEAGASASGYLALLLELGLVPHRIEGGSLRLLDLDRLVQACRRLEGGDFAALRARCTGLAAAQIDAAAFAYAQGLGYDQPLIENLVFTRGAP